MSNLTMESGQKIVALATDELKTAAPHKGTGHLYDGKLW